MDVPSQIKVQSTVKSVINSYLTSHEYISGITVNIGNLVYSGGQTLPDADREFIANAGFIDLNRLKTASWKHYFSVDTIESQLYLNSCRILVEIEAFQESIFTQTGANRTEYIISSSGNILLSTNEASIWSSAGSQFSFPLTDGYFEITSLSGEDHYCLVKSTDDTGSFYYVSMLPTSYYSSFKTTALWQSIGIGAVIAAVFMTAVYLIVSFVYRPVKKVANILSQYYPEMPVDTNEVTYIEQQISKTFREKQNLEQQLPEALTKLNHAQIVAMQSQINPHFLFNTLENIKGMSVKHYGINNSIERAILLLGKIVSESIRQNKILTTVHNEIEVTKSYIELMQMRFKERFQVVWDVDEEIRDHAIIRFTLQPILENSILKGFVAAKNKLVTISIRAEEQNIVLTVTDDGKGIPAQQLAKIRAAIEDLEEPPDSHVGLKNVNMRFKMLYGRFYGIRSIESTEGLGTTVKLVYPHTKLPF